MKKRKNPKIKGIFLHPYEYSNLIIDFIEYRYKKMYNRCVDIISHIITVKQNNERTSGVF